MKILEKTISEMPNSFTSNEFNKRAVENGYPPKILKKKGLASFIRRYADNAYEGSKTWVKRDENKTIMTDEEMIEHLKRKGHKVLKCVNEWVEC